MDYCRLFGVISKTKMLLDLLKTAKRLFPATNRLGFRSGLDILRVWVVGRDHLPHKTTGANPMHQGLALIPQSRSQ